jgi:hypothetical protein
MRAPEPAAARHRAVREGEAKLAEIFFCLLREWGPAVAWTAGWGRGLLLWRCVRVVVRPADALLA